MQFSMWTYPWDIQDLGPDRVVAELQAIGCNGVSLATSYHAGRFLQPRSPTRKCYYPEGGTIYFEPRLALWAESRIQPQVASVVRDGGDVLADLIRRRDDAGGPAVSCWTVCLHNSRLGALHPEAVTRNAFGQGNVFSLCPSHPDARRYVRTLVQDVSLHYRPDVIELEVPCFMGYAHGHHHEKDGVGLTPEDDFFLSLCFCPSCMERAGRAGVDAEAARQTVRGFIAEACERPVPVSRFPDFPDAGPDLFRAYPALHAFLLWRFEPVTSLIAEIRAVAAPATKIVLIDFANGWVSGCDLPAIAREGDGAILCGYDMTPEAVGALMQWGRTMVGPDKFLGTGFRLFYPEMTGAADIVARAVAAAQNGADRINFYNYGLVPAARLAWVAEAVSAVHAAAATDAGP